MTVPMTKRARMMTSPEGLKPGFLIGCQAAPFHQYSRSCETQAAPSKTAGRPSGPVTCEFTVAAIVAHWPAVRSSYGPLGILGRVELDEETAAADIVPLVSSVPARHGTAGS